MGQTQQRAKVLDVAGQPAQRLAAVLARHRISDVDFLVMDLEGYEPWYAPFCQGSGRPFTWCVGDLSGRSLDMFAQTDPLCTMPDPRGPALLERVLAAQHPDGHFGDDRDDRQGPWTPAQILNALCDWAQLHDDETCWQAAQRAAQYAVEHTDQWIMLFSEEEGLNAKAGAWMLDGLAKLYARDQNPAWKAPAERVRDLIKPCSGVRNQHSHLYLSGVRGIAMWAEATGETAWLDKVVTIWEDIIEHDLVRPADGNAPGGFPHNTVDEGCTLADWTRLNLDLWRLTSQRRYLDHAERCLWNAFFCNQLPSGGFGSHGLTRYSYKQDHSEAWMCCNMHCAVGLAEVIKHIVTTADDGVQVNFFIPARMQVAMNESPVELHIRTTWPEGGDVTITLYPAKPSEFQLSIRLPEWARQVSVQVNGDPQAGKVNADGFAQLKRLWQKGDKIDIRFPVGVRTEQFGGERESGVGYEYFDDVAREVALYHGPMLLAPIGGCIPDAQPQITLPRADDHGFLPLEKAPYDWRGPGLAPGAPVFTEGVCYQAQLSWPDLGISRRNCELLPLAYHRQAFDLYHTPILFQREQ